MSYVNDQFLGEEEIMEAFWNHDCKLSEEDGCAVCEAYYKALADTCKMCKKFPCQCDNIYEAGKDHCHD